MLTTNGLPMIEAISLSKLFGTFAAIRDVSFAVNQGQVAAFLGPNGAGKSTTLKILTGYLTPSAGTARIAGLDVSTHRIEAAGRIGYLPENGPLYPEMTPRELLEFFGQARGLSEVHMRDRIEAVVTQCNLRDVMEKSIHKLSKGYRQRVGMAQVLLHEPDILIMDEPTSGLDPNQIRDVRELIRELGQTKTILISTHILQEVQAVANHVILINEGRIVFDGTVDEMAAGESLEQAFYRLTGRKDEQAAEAVAVSAATSVPPAAPAGDGTSASPQAPGAPVTAAEATAAADGLKPPGPATSEPTDQPAAPLDESVGRPAVSDGSSEGQSEAPADRETSLSKTPTTTGENAP